VQKETVHITVNGDDRAIVSGSTVAALLQELQLDPRFLAVERNRQLVPRAQHAATVLEANDEIEIVTLVGGG